MSPESQVFLSQSTALVARLYRESGAERWGVSPAVFRLAVERSVQKSLGSGTLVGAEVQEYLSRLHLQDLALACACSEGIAAAWEEFIAAYRGYLRTSAAAILRCRADAAEALELADSLFTDLYGLSDGLRHERSLFRYFHGRSSLKTWLRAVLAQRRVDQVRAAKRFESLESPDGPDGEPRLREPRDSAAPLALDPDRERYLSLFKAALEAALKALPPRDAERLRFYYAHEQTLAEIGRRLGEHESSVSRNLERVRKELRVRVEELLRSGNVRLDGQTQNGLSEAQIVLCFEYATTGEAPIDLDKLFAQEPRRQAQSEKPKP